MTGPTRVKHRIIAESRRNARFALAETPERAVNKGHMEGICTADFPHPMNPLSQLRGFCCAIRENSAAMGGLLGRGWKTFKQRELK